MTDCSTDCATFEIYPLSLHDALPILLVASRSVSNCGVMEIPTELSSSTLGETATASVAASIGWSATDADRKSTRLNSSHVAMSYAVFCLKKKKFLLAVPARYSIYLTS